MPFYDVASAYHDPLPSSSVDLPAKGKEYHCDLSKIDLPLNKCIRHEISVPHPLLSQFLVFPASVVVTKAFVVGTAISFLPLLLLHTHATLNLYHN